MGQLKEFGEWSLDVEKQLMRCTFCIAFPKHASSSLVNGCDNFKRETLIEHLKSKAMFINEILNTVILYFFLQNLLHIHLAEIMIIIPISSAQCE